jgi:hypothetical protein
MRQRFNVASLISAVLLIKEPEIARKTFYFQLDNDGAFFCIA